MPGLVLEPANPPSVEFGSSGFWRDAVFLSRLRQALVTKPADAQLPPSPPSPSYCSYLLTLSLFLILPAIDKAG